MGKRELVLIVSFIFLGTILYQATAPPSPEGRGFSIRGMIDNIRREVGPRNEYLADQRTQTIPVGRESAEIRVVNVRELRVEGTDRTDIQARLQVYSTGLDENEARALGKRTVLNPRTSGDLLMLEMTYPPEGRQRATLTLSVPRRLRVRVSRVTRLDASGIGGLELDNTRGTATIKKIDGTLRGTHNGGELTIEEVKQLDLVARRSEITLTKASGSVRLDLTGGQLTARDIAGDMEIDANRVGIEIESITGLLTADLSQGSLEVRRLVKQARVDARGTELRFEYDRPAPLSAVTTDESINVRLPEKAGVSVDATVDEGEIRLPEGTLTPTRSDQTSTARGDLRGGGPMLTLRTTHADIVVR